MGQTADPLTANSFDSAKVLSFAQIARDVGSWLTIGLLAIIPYQMATKSLEEILVYGPVAILFLTWLTTWIVVDPEKRRPAPRAVSPFVIGTIVLTVITALISVRFSMDRGSSITDFKHQMLKFVLTFVIALNLLRTTEWRRRAYCAFLVIGAGAAIYTLVGYYTRRAVDIGPPLRALGPSWSYTRTSMYFVLWIPLALAGVLYGGFRGRWVKGLMIANILIAWWAVIMTQTRGAMLAIFLSTAILAGLRRWKWSAALLVVALVSAALVPSFRDRCLVTARNLSDPNELLSDRIPLWKNAISAISHHPLTGVGYGSEIFQSDALRVAYPMFNFKYQPHAHQFYLETACESGIIHLAALLAFFLGFLITAGRALRFARTPGTDLAIVIGTFTGIAAMLVYGFVGHFHETRIGMLMWYLMAIGFTASADNRLKDGRPEPSASN